jgi:nucleoid-associated protein YgaU
MHAHDPRRPRRSASPSLSFTLAACLSAWGPAATAAQSLQGSTASLDRQNYAARQHDFSFLETDERVGFFAAQGWLVEVKPSAHLALRGVSFPYARSEVDLFLRRLARQYRDACGEQLVVTSLTRPTTRQPRNASDRSVHPTGMALDLRYSYDRACRSWLERVLLQLERADVLEATRERSPVHYHIALFPREYAAYVDALDARQAAAAQDRMAYRVRSGDSLWAIARSHGTTVDQLRLANQLRNNRIYVGQVLDVPLD